MDFLFAKTREKAIIPTKRKQDGCYDVYACFEEEELRIEPNSTKLISTGICSAFPEEYFISLRERGSNTKSCMIVQAGIIDSSYRGEWFVAIYNGNNVPLIISKSHSEVEKLQECIFVPYSKAIAQLAIEKNTHIDFKEVSKNEILSFETERGTGSLGSSGK